MGILRKGVSVKKVNRKQSHVRNIDVSHRPKFDPIWQAFLDRWLLNGVYDYRTLPLLPEGVFLCQTLQETNLVLLQLRALNPIVVGFDTEERPHTEKGQGVHTDVVQLRTHDMLVVIHLAAMGLSNGEGFYFYFFFV